MKERMNTKRTLQFSILSIMICVAMLIGSTYAWFSDSITNANNHITAGNLDVELTHSNAFIQDEIVEATTKLFLNHEGQEIKWEPGASTYETFTIRNNGALALKYRLGIHIDNFNTANGKSLKDVLKIAIVDGSLKEDQNEIPADTLFQPIDEMIKKEGVLLNKDDAVSYTVIIKWEPSIYDNAFNVTNQQTSDSKPLFVELGVNLDATQTPHESDAFGNDYDQNASYFREVKTEEQLIDALNNGDNVSLTENITLTNSLKLTQDQSLTIQLNQKTLKSNSGHTITAMNDANVTVLNGVLECHNNNAAVVYAEGNANVTIENCQLRYKANGGYGVVTNGSLSKNTTIQIKNSEIVYNKGYACYFPAGTISLENCVVTGAVIISGGSVDINGGRYIADGFNAQAKIWHQADTINYMKKFANYDGAGHMGDAILIMDRRSPSYQLKHVSIRNVTFDTELTLVDGTKDVAYAIKYVDYNNIPGNEAVQYVVENNTYLHQLKDGKDPLMFIPIE